MRAANSRILLVDREDTHVKHLREILERSGFHVTHAPDRHAAGRLMRECEPDVVVLDITQEIGGVRLLRSLLQRDGTFRHPVIVCSTRTAMRAFCEEIGVSAFLPKPCETHRLLSAIAGALRVTSVDCPADGRTVLIAEDDEQVAAQLSHAFSEAGHHVEHVVRGDTAFEHAVLKRPDAMLVKRVLPGMNGDMVARLMQDMFHPETIPVVLYEEEGSDYDMPSERHKHTAPTIRTSDAWTLLAETEELLMGRRRARALAV